MPITDQTLLSELQRVLVENAGDGGATWPSGQWTQAEVLWHLNRRQDRLIAESSLVWTLQQSPIITNQAAQPAPPDWAETLLIVYVSSTRSYTELPKVDSLELDLALPGWPGTTTPSMPRGWYEIDGAATLTTYVAPIPTEASSYLERYYVALGATLTAGGILFAVPDELVPCLKYGVLSDLLRKVGQSQNLPLADLAEQRWSEGFEMAKLIAQEGWFAL